MHRKKMLITGAALAALLILAIWIVPHLSEPTEPLPPDDPAADSQPEIDHGDNDDSGVSPPQEDDPPPDGRPASDGDTPSEPSGSESDGDTSGDDAPDVDTPGDIQPPESPDDSAPDPKAQPDENGMMDINGRWVAAPASLSHSSIEGFAKKLNSLKASYLETAASIHYSVIPDKSFYAAPYTDHYLNHTEIMQKLSAHLAGWSYIELSDLLSLEDYYLTDAHWRQEKIVPVAQRLAKALGFEVSKNDFTQQSQSGFVGDYRRFIGVELTEDICWLESPLVLAATCDNFQRPEVKGVYDSSRLSTNSPYDLFLGGPSPLVTLANSSAAEQNHLIVFCDSFGSSLSPLLLSGYSKITLVDIRYMVSDLLPEYVDFTGADVLFIYSAAVVNNSAMLR